MSFSRGSTVVFLCTVAKEHSLCVRQGSVTPVQFVCLGMYVHTGYVSGVNLYLDLSTKISS